MILRENHVLKIQMKQKFLFFFIKKAAGNHEKVSSSLENKTATIGR